MDNLLSSVYYAVLKFFAGLLPDSNGFGESISTAIAQVMVTGSQLSFAINWTVIFSCLAAVLVFESSLFLTKIIMWIIKLARG